MAMWDLCQQIGLTWHSNSVIHPVCRQDKPCGELGAQDRDDLTKPMFTSLFEIFFLKRLYASTHRCDCRHVLVTKEAKGSISSPGTGVADGRVLWGFVHCVKMHGCD